MHAQDVSCDDQVKSFFEESEQDLAVMEKAVAGLAGNPADADPLRILLRAAHELRTEAGSLGFRELADATAELEDILERTSSGSIAVGREVMDVLALSMDVLRELLAEARR
jgi:two-component system, chemotaxis family, sensor kinase CheA